MNQNILKVTHLTKTYIDGDTKVVALDNVSLSLKKGENMAIIGPSGSGKTTLLQLIGALSEPTSGIVTINEKDISKFSDKEVSKFRNETLGFVFQSMYLQDYFTALENVMLPMLVAGKSKAFSQTRATKLLKKVGLENRINHMPNKLSGGEMQRVAIARALANKPKIILADEPTGKLDEDNANKVMDILNDVSGDDVSVIVITHDKSIAKRFKKIITLKHGKLQSS